MKFRCKRVGPNVCVLDCGRFRLDGKRIGREREEILRADRLAREACGYKIRTMIGIQPWRRPQEELCHEFSAEYEIFAEDEMHGIRLALERPQTRTLYFNGERVAEKPSGWFIDRAIRTIALPAFKKGKNVLQITEPFGNNTDPEACYLLGDFGADADETQTRIFPPQKLEIGSLEGQGLKFYGQNVDYTFEVCLRERGSVRISVPHFGGQLIGVAIDGTEAGNIVYAPYVFESEALPAGKHAIRLRLYGDNYNTFSPLHVRGEIVWTGDYSWYAEEEGWTYGYLTKPYGIFTAPSVEIVYGRKTD